jgi:archaellum component FlaC
MSFLEEFIEKAKKKKVPNKEVMRVFDSTLLELEEPLKQVDEDSHFNKVFQELKSLRPEVEEALEKGNTEKIHSVLIRLKIFDESLHEAITESAEGTGLTELMQPEISYDDFKTELENRVTSGRVDHIQDRLEELSSFTKGNLADSVERLRGEVQKVKKEDIQERDKLEKELKRDEGEMEALHEEIEKNRKHLEQTVDTLKKVLKERDSTLGAMKEELDKAKAAKRGAAGRLNEVLELIGILDKRVDRWAAESEKNAQEINTLMSKVRDVSESDLTKLRKEIQVIAKEMIKIEESEKKIAEEQGKLKEALSKGKLHHDVKRLIPLHPGEW